jgi:hypothetical protein
MGDGFQIIVDREASLEEAPHLAERVREWLVARRIIEPALSDCALGAIGHRPGPGYTAAVETPAREYFKRLAEACGYGFVVGVRSEAHKTALSFADPSLEVVVMDWC